jgi:hypothetical protein
VFLASSLLGVRRSEERERESDIVTRETGGEGRYRQGERKIEKNPIFSPLL